MSSANSGAEVLDTKRGFPVFDRNPSVPAPGSFSMRSKPLRITNGNRIMVVGEDSGEVLGRGHAGFYELKEVDEQQFVKLYAAGVKQTTKLTKAGLQVFELFFHQMRANPQSDRLEMNHYLAKRHGLNISIQTYRRGLRELLEHEFVFRSPIGEVYFVNINFFFNGNRITLAKQYYVKGSVEQQELPFAPPVPAPTAPESSS
jgi:hypothetical protein